MCPVYEIHGSGAGVLEFLTGHNLHSTRSAAIRWDSLFSKQEECLHSGASGAHWQNFKLDMKRERNNTRLACDDERARLERLRPSEGPQLVTLRHPCYTWNLSSAADMPEG